ncbi:hypothetical protein CCYA_CCYA12G3263 [Cyanidiococcus yangmingshanensis]|nr:hypothetical protein CCYA_CCYA12G3263 [Cyanidiococcus yangmingshanensis]
MLGRLAFSTAPAVVVTKQRPVCSRLRRRASSAHELSFGERQTRKPPQLRCTLTPYEPFTVRPNLTLPLVVLGLSGVLAGAGGGAGKVFAVPVGLLGVFLVINAGLLLRFRFGPDSIEVWRRGSSGESQVAGVKDAALDGYHYVRGWHYDRIEYWKLWWSRFPVLFYFRETESYDGRGSIHFLPVVFDTQQWLRGFEERTQRKETQRFRY